LKKYGLQIKDYNPETQAGVNQGCCDSFEFLGFDIKRGVTVPNLAKLFVQTIWPERLLEGVSPIGQMATRARGISHINKGCHPEISLLCEALSNRCLASQQSNMFGRDVSCLARRSSKRFSLLLQPREKKHSGMDLKVQLGIPYNDITS